jgi:hypothetical protein
MSLARELALAPAYAAYGVWVLLRWAWRVGHDLRATRQLFRTHIRCGTCGFGNAVHDRWACGDCGAEYAGAVHTCGVCGSSASWFPCSRCRAAIPVGTP